MLLDVDVGFFINRIVYIFVGRFEDVVEGVFNVVRIVFRFIDMSRYKGEGFGASGLLFCL